MSLIRKWLCVCISTALAAFVCALVLVALSSVMRVAKTTFLLLVTMTLFFTILSIIGHRRLQAARLIIENKILYICQARIITKNRKEKSIDVYISCFGILLDFRLIRFNQNNVYLKSVEISDDFICLAYGLDDRSQTIQLLHGPMGEGELADVMERFQYETGIIPKIIK